MLRVSFDGEAWALGHRTHPIGDDARQVVNGTLQDKLVDCVKQGEGRRGCGLLVLVPCLAR